MPVIRSLSVVGVHAEGEVGDVITGGVLDIPGTTIYEKMMHLWTKGDDLRQLLLNEPRGRSSMNTNLVLPPCDPRADAGLIIMESYEYAPMSGSNAMCAATVLLETGTIPMKEPVTTLTLETPAGLVKVEAQCVAGKCRTVTVENVPSFAIQLDVPVDVPGLGEIKVDIAWGGLMHAIVDATSIGLSLENSNGRQIIEIGQKTKTAVQAQTDPVHPENPGIRGVNNIVFTLPLQENKEGKTATNVVVVCGRIDRSPCGTGTCARMAVLHARGLLGINEKFQHRNKLGTFFTGWITGTTKVGKYTAVYPKVQGRAWITSYKQIVLDAEDPFPRGFRVGDHWHDVEIEDFPPKLLNGSSSSD